MPTAQPGPAHHALMTDLRGVLERYGSAGMPVVEQLAVASQVVGQIIAVLDPRSGFTPAEVMHAVSANIANGNASEAARNNGRIVGPAS